MLVSCQSLDQFKSTARLTQRLTGVDPQAVEVTLQRLLREADGADLPAPTGEEMDGWHAEMITALEDSVLPLGLKNSLGKGLLRARLDIADGRDFYAHRTLLHRTRQQALVKSVSGIVEVAPPRAQSRQYTLAADGRPAQVYYASYGSNLRMERMAVYIDGGTPNGGRTIYAGARDKSPIAESLPVALPGIVHYAGDSDVWSGGVAFLDPNAGGRSLGRAHLITTEQFDDVVFQESNPGERPDGAKVDLNATLRDGRTTGKGTYGTLVHVGDHNGTPVVTFTSAFSMADALRGDLVVTTEGAVVSAVSRASAHAAQQRAIAEEQRAARAENRPVRPVRRDWPIFSNSPSASYQSMIGGGLRETHGLTEDDVSTYFKGATGFGVATARGLSAMPKSA